MGGGWRRGVEGGGMGGGGKALKKASMHVPSLQSYSKYWHDAVMEDVNIVSLNNKAMQKYN